MQYAGIDCLVLGPGTNMAYLLGRSHGSFERLTALIVSRDRGPTLIVPELEYGLMTDCLPTDVEVIPWKDGADPIAEVSVALAGAHRVSVDAELPARVVLSMRDRLPTIRLLLDTTLPATRMIKDEWEIQQLSIAGQAVNRVHRDIPNLLAPGITEEEIARQIRVLMYEAGFTGDMFLSVASGANGSRPHHAHSDRRLAAGDVIVVDLSGVIASGYHADCTRTYALEPVGAEIESAYATLKHAFDCAVAAVTPGATTGQLDRCARSRLDAEHLGALFTHRLGHGIGLDIHEPPYLVADDHLPIAQGMTFSVEPGLYRAGHWGMRIEDIVAVTATSCQSLNATNHDLQRIG